MLCLHDSDFLNDQGGTVTGIIPLVEFESALWEHKRALAKVDLR